MPKYLYWDMKYYYQIHCARQTAMWNHPIAYETFTRRLKRMNLHDAVYSPRTESQVRDINKIRKNPIQDAVRRKQIEKEENVQVIHPVRVAGHRKPNRIQMPKKKPSLRNRFISFFK